MHCCSESLWLLLLALHLVDSRLLKEGILTARREYGGARRSFFFFFLKSFQSQTFPIFLCARCSPKLTEAECPAAEKCKRSADSGAALKKQMQTWHNRLTLHNESVRPSRPSYCHLTQVPGTVSRNTSAHCGSRTTGMKSSAWSESVDGCTENEVKSDTWLLDWKLVCTNTYIQRTPSNPNSWPGSFLYFVSSYNWQVNVNVKVKLLCKVVMWKQSRMFSR